MLCKVALGFRKVSRNQIIIINIIIVITKPETFWPNIISATQF